MKRSSAETPVQPLYFPNIDPDDPRGYSPIGMSSARLVLAGIPHGLA